MSKEFDSSKFKHERAKARRRKQIAKGMIKKANGLVVKNENR